MPASTVDKTVVVKGVATQTDDMPPDATARAPELPRALNLDDNDALKIAQEVIRKQLDLPDAKLVSNEQIFVTKTRDQVKSAQLPLGDMNTLAGETGESPLCIFLRGDKQVSISTSRAETDLYVEGEISTLAWASFEAFARGTWRMLAAALKIDLNEIGFSHGVLIGERKFCLAAKFELKRCQADSLRSAPTQKRIATCTGLLAHFDLWNDAALSRAYPDPLDADLIKAVREARQEISSKELPFSCVIENDFWPEPFQILKVLAARRAPTTTMNPRCEIGKSTGYCTDSRQFHFKVSKNSSLENIGFDEQEYFDEILDVSGKKTPLIEVSWTEELQDKSIIARTLKKITRVMEVLC